jgi:ABC-type antimicrobial peptide transport system permease subunit
MAGIAELALGAAPIAGGALLGVAAGNLRAPDVRGMIAKDMDLLERIPDDRPELKARLRASINQRIDDLISTAERSRQIRLAAMSYRGNWRDIVVFICAILFTIVWWNVSHSRSNWLVMFIVMIIASVVAGVYASRGLVRAVRQSLHSRDLNANPDKRFQSAPEREG